MLGSPGGRVAVLSRVTVNWGSSWPFPLGSCNYFWGTSARLCGVVVYKKLSEALLWQVVANNYLVNIVDSFYDNVTVLLQSSRPTLRDYGGWKWTWCAHVRES